MKQKPTDKYPKLQTRYEVIEKQKRAHFELVRKSLTADGSNIYFKGPSHSCSPETVS